jgi:TonB family protein
VVAASTGAVLSVTDGTRHFERKLDAGQVADGEVKYTPVSGDVTFQLRVYGQDQTMASASLRVLDATAPVMADTKVPLDVSGSTTTPATNISPAVLPQQPPQQAAANGLPTNNNTKPETHVGEVANKVNLPAAMTPPPITALDVPPVEAAKPAPQTAAAQQPQTQSPQQQQPPVQTAKQEQPAATTAAPAAKPAPRTPATGGGSTAPLTSNTAINGWDPNLPENKPAPVQQQQAQPPDSKVVDFVAPKVLLQVMPNPRSLTPGSITEVTRVEVEVQIDRNGHVRSAHVTNPNVKSQLAAVAVAAAKQWTFLPATLRGQAVDSDHTIRFDFTPERQ